MRLFKLFLLLIIILTLLSCERKPGDQNILVPTEVQEVVLSSGLKYIDIREGRGKAAKNGDKVSLTYKGYKKSGFNIFRSGHDDNYPNEFILGEYTIIRGLNQGIVGMKVGGVRKLTIPPALGFGEEGIFDVLSGDETFYIDVKLVGLQSKIK